MTEYRDLMDLDYTAHDHAVDFEQELEERRLRDPELQFSYHFDEGIPVFNVSAEGKRKQYIDSYRLEGMRPSDFEEKGFDLWKEAFEDQINPDVDDLLE